jgi:hypothetical protein
MIGKMQDGQVESVVPPLIKDDLAWGYETAEMLISSPSRSRPGSDHDLPVSAGQCSSEQGRPKILQIALSATPNSRGGGRTPCLVSHQAKTKSPPTRRVGPDLR